MTTPDGAVSIAKAGLRRSLIRARRAVPDSVRAAEADALTTSARVLLALPRLPGTVCAYWPLPTEPGSPALLDALRGAGCRVLLPVVTGAAPLDWAVHDGLRQPGPAGIAEPAGPRLGPATVRDAALVLVPALAVDRAGGRLGRGGGHYDRTLALAAPGATLVAVVRDDELLDELPVASHDVPVTAALLPGRGLVRLVGPVATR